MYLVSWFLGAYEGLKELRTWTAEILENLPLSGSFSSGPGSTINPRPFPLNATEKPAIRNKNDWIMRRACPGSVVHTWNFDPQLRWRPDLLPRCSLTLELFDSRTFEVDGQSYVTGRTPLNLTLRVCLYLIVGFIQPPQAGLLAPAASRSSIAEQDTLQRRRLAWNEVDLWDA